MILVQNLQPLLSGNKTYRLLGVLLLLFLGQACSPRKNANPVAVVAKTQEVGEERLSYKKSRYKYNTSTSQEFSIHLFLPFNLKKVNLDAFTTNNAWEEMVPMGFYQGFKLALDSSASMSTHKYKLIVHDWQEEEEFTINTTEQNALNTLLVGASLSVSEVEELNAKAKMYGIPVIFPLSSPSPRRSTNPNQITLQATIDVHTQKIASYLTSRQDLEMIYLLNPAPSDNTLFTGSFQSSLAALTFKTISSTSEIIIPEEMEKTKKIVVINVSAQGREIAPICQELQNMAQSKNVSITLLGRPEWLKLNLKPELFTNLEVYITSSYKAFYRNTNTHQFADIYRTTYELQPNEYAFKGFDAGYYLTNVINRYGKEWFSYLTYTKHKGLRQDFDIQQISNRGFFNQNVYLLRYSKDRFDSPISF